MEDDFYIDYGKLDPLQREYVDKKVNKSMVVSGAAGSGKSVIALHKAKQVSALGSYEIVVYTKTLEQYFHDGLQKLDLGNVSHYHQWRRNKKHVQYLIVDECQDFSKEEIDSFVENGTICFFFGDTEQSIMKFRKDSEGNPIPLQSVQQTALSLGVTMLPLQKNYRLTKENALLAEFLGKKEELAENCVRQGEKPEFILTDSIEKQIDEIIRLKHNKSLESVGVFLPFNTMEKAQKGNYYLNSKVSEPEKLSVEYVKNYILQKGEPVEYKYDANGSTDMDLDFHTSNIKVMTWECAKGLQFRDVFIPNCQVDYGENRRTAYYVALTRCSERLYLLSSGNPSSNFFPDKNSDIYKKELDLSEFDF